MPAIALRRITKGYGRKKVLEDLELEVEPGSFLVVFGPPACGKSVLVRLLTGLERPDAGELWLRGRKAGSQSSAERNIGYVPQSFALYPHYNVHDNIAYPLTLMRMPRSEIELKVRRVSEQLKIAHLLEKQPDQLSGGEKQRVALARGIVKPTDVFILDDPLTGLDFKLREQLFDDLRAMQHRLGATFVYTTSDALEALALADRIAILDTGRVLESGSVETVYRRPRNVRTMELLGVPPSNRLPGLLRTHDGALRCDVGLFDFGLDPAGGEAVGVAGQRIDVVIRPQDVQLVTGGGDGLLTCPADVILREDLGAEVVVYLRARRMPLVAVAPYGGRGHGVDEGVKVGVHPAAAAVFATDTGIRLGQGA